MSEYQECKPSALEWEVDPDLLYRRVPEGKERMLGFAEGSLAGQSLFTLMHADDVKKTRGALYTRTGAPRAFLRLIARFVRADGALFVANMSGAPVHDEQGRFLGFRGIERTVGAMGRQPGAASPLQLEAIFALAPISLCVVDRNVRLVAVNEKHAALSGHMAHQLYDDNIGDRLPHIGRKILQDFEVLDSGREIAPHESHIYGKDYIVSVTAIPGANGRIAGICVTHQDITERKRLERELAAANQRLAEINVRDYLTGAFNRRYFDEVLATQISHLAQCGESLSLAIMDVDHFKLYNDAYGHLAGDECLTAVAGTMAEVLRAEGFDLYRYGGEEFAVIMPDTPRQRAVAVAQGMRKAVAALEIPHRDSANGCVTISIGVASVGTSCAQFGARAVASLIKIADRALYAAKSGGRNAVVSGHCTPLDTESHAE